MRKMFATCSHLAPLLLLSMLSHWLPSADAHGGLVNPLPRNAIDRQLPWADRAPPHPCICANATAGSADPQHPIGGCDLAQACYWYQQGCTIGCDKCDSISGRSQIDVCGKGKKATINDPKLRTVNRASEAGSDLDIYKHNPWRAPGTAPVTDSCGLAGGVEGGAPVAEWGDYVNTTFASHGDRGSKVLPYFPTSTKWFRGHEAEVIWQIIANHGGGYQYRLCPLNEPLTEECFQKMPLDFVQNSQALQWNNGSRLAIQGTYVSEGTWPNGSMWAMNPIPPRCLSGNCRAGSGCNPCPGVAGTDCMTCDDTPDHKFPPPCPEGDKPGLCSGNQPSLWGSVGVVDRVLVPTDITPGKYVLGWRLDCEATAQIWTNCADIEIEDYIVH